MKDLISKISKKEWLVVTGLALVVMVITVAPYIYGYWAAPAGTTYNGLHALSPGDIPVYYSYINQVKNGQWLVKDLFTSEPQELGTFNVWWAGVGGLAKIFDLSAPLVFQLARVLMIPVFIFWAYIFLAYFFTKPAQRQIALVFLLFSSGVGGYLAGPADLSSSASAGNPNIYAWPIDLWIPEAITFNALFQTSHFIASITLTILIFLLLLLFFDTGRWRYAVWAGIVSLFYFNLHPYYLPVIFGTAGLYLFILMVKANKFLWQRSAGLILTFLISLPAIWYHVWLIKSSPEIAQRALQNVTNISPVFFVLVGYGALIAGFFVGVYFLVKNKKLTNGHWFLLTWLGVNVFLIYSPFPFHSRYTQGLHVVLVIFTVIGALELYERLRQKLAAPTFHFWIKNPALLSMLFMVMFMPSTLFLVIRDIYLFSQPGLQASAKFYLSADFMAANKFLSQQSAGNVVLASNIPALFIPGLSGQAVYAAHAHETLFSYSKAAYVRSFYLTTGQAEFKKKFLRQNSIDYVFFGEYENKFGKFDPSQVDFLELAFDSPTIRIYKVAGD